MRRYIVDILKYITISYINVFMFISVVVNVLAAIKSSQLLWLLNYTLWMWLIAEVLVYVIRRVIKFINKSNKEGKVKNESVRGYNKNH